MQRPSIAVDSLTVTVTYGDGQSRSALSYSAPFGPKVSLTPIRPGSGYVRPFLRFHQLGMIPAHLTPITDPHPRYVFSPFRKDSDRGQREQEQLGLSISNEKG